MRIYGIRNWTGQSCKQVKDEFGWADFQVRSDLAIRHHQVLVNCAFSFCWAAWFADHVPQHEAAPLPEPGYGERGAPAAPAPPPSWPRAIRAVRAWLSPWIALQHWWAAWPKARLCPAHRFRHLQASASLGHSNGGAGGHVSESTVVRRTWQRIRVIQAVKWLRNTPALHAVVSPFWYGQNVDQYGTFVARELTRRLRPDRSPTRYTLRSQKLSVRMRHNHVDANILEEIFGRKVYEPPASAAAQLPRDADLTLLDIGGNIGMFAVFALARWPRSKVISFEPDPQNIVVLKQCIVDNAIADRWTSIEAAASTSNRTLTFLSVGGGTSRIASVAVRGGKLIEVAAIDIFDWLGKANLVKMDIEGGEWPILMDDRFGAALPQVIVLEYHQEGCPVTDSYGAVSDRLTHLGYEIEHMPAQDDHEDSGIVWAWRSPSHP